MLSAERSCGLSVGQTHLDAPEASSHHLHSSQSPSTHQMLHA